MSPDAPPPLDPAARPAVESPAAEALRRRRADRAAQALVSPWSKARARRVRLVALVLVIVGPLLGIAFALLVVPDEPTDVVTAPDDAPADLDVAATVRSVDPSTGEMRVRMVVLIPPESSLRNDDGTLNEDIDLVVPDAVGEGVRPLLEGQLPGAVEITLALSGSRATRYPVDRYRTRLVVVALRDGTEDAVPVRLSLRSSDPFFSTTTVDAPDDGAANVELRVQRRWTVVGWAAFFVLICWLLAISAASIGWTTVVHGVAAPAWSWGFLIGVLFALPPLRSALPGSPQGGSLVDLAAFYWAVGIVALTLVAMIGSWNMRVRRAPGSPDSPRP